MLATTATGFHIGLLATTFWFGFRHGIDWDHIAALTDISASQETPRRSLTLATLYAVGHALVVFVLGLGAIVLAEQLPDGVDLVMQRVVGATLVALGMYVMVALARHGRDFRMRSRWMLVLSGLRRLRRRRSVAEPIVIEHEHEHADAHGHVHVLVGEHAQGYPVHASAHSHVHHHVAALPDDPFIRYRGSTALGIGMLHGIGAETPTQVVLFVTAAGAGGSATGIVLLVAFLVGLLTSNSLIALAGTYGFLGATKRWPVYVTVSVLTGLGSLLVGSLFLFGSGDLLPAVFSG